jgi:hypothetical protein
MEGPARIGGRAIFNNASMAAFRLRHSLSVAERGQSHAFEKWKGI